MSEANGKLMATFEQHVCEEDGNQPAAQSAGKTTN
jgi:hypothetical protein